MHPAWHCHVSVGRLQRAQVGGTHQDHLVIAGPPVSCTQDTQAHQEPSRSCCSQASRCPPMPPASSTNGWLTLPPRDANFSVGSQELRNDFGKFSINLRPELLNDLAEMERSRIKVLDQFEIRML
jgi:hypothetical protein